MSPKNENDAEVIAKSAATLKVFTPEMQKYLLSLIPTSESYAELHERMQVNYSGVLNGDPEKTKMFEADRKAIDCENSLIHGLAKVLAVKDPTVQELLGHGRVPEKAAHATFSLSEPLNFKVVFDIKGHATASVGKVEGAKGYQIWACDGDPGIEANWRLATSSTSCKGIALTGLNRGKLTFLKIRAMRSNGAGPWSNLYSLDPA